MSDVNKADARLSVCAHDTRASAGRGDPVNQPAHYTRSTIEPIAVIEAWGLGFHLGNAVKYIARAGHKGDTLEDLEKARWYLNRAIDGVRSGQPINVALAELRDAPAVDMRGVVEFDLSDLEDA